MILLIFQKFIVDGEDLGRCRCRQNGQFVVESTFSQTPTKPPLEILGWSGPMFSGLKAILFSLESSCQDIFSISDILEGAAAAAENAALETKQENIDMKGDAGAHVVGITSRAVFQAFKITQK